MIKVLSETMTPGHAAEFIRVTVDGQDYRMKILMENGNCYSRLTVYTVSMESGCNILASNYDIPGYVSVSYAASDDKRIQGNKSNIAVAKDWINKVFCSALK